MGVAGLIYCCCLLSAHGLSPSILSPLNTGRRSEPESPRPPRPSPPGRGENEEWTRHPGICQAELVFHKLSEMPPGPGRQSLNMKHCSWQRGRKRYQETSTAKCWQELWYLEITGEKPGILNTNCRESEAIWLTGMKEINILILRKLIHAKASIW